MARPANICEVLRKERRFARALRARRGGGVQRLVSDEQSRRLALNGRPTDMVGLALSGGGIRSATFALGVMEALRELKLLKQVDYLSTVSGGGFIGGWLVAGCRSQRGWCDPPEGSAVDPWLGSISQLRETSNYLYPRSGSPHLPMFTIWLRNELLVLTMVLALLSSLLLVPIAGLGCAAWLARHPFLLWSAALLLIGAPLVGYCCILCRLSDRIPRRRPGHAGAVGLGCVSFLAGCVLVSIGVAEGAGANLGWSGRGVGCLIALSVGWVSLRKRREWKEPAGEIRVALAVVVSGCLLSLGLQTVAGFIASRESLVVFGPLLLSGVVWGSDTVLAGLLGRKQLDICREWRSAVTSLSLSITLLATATVSLALFAPWIVDQLVTLTGRAFPALSISWVAGAIWALLTRPANPGPNRWWTPTYEPPEVLNYARQAPDFPHESTGDQFFSEAQFESYRCLGRHVARETFERFCSQESIHRVAEDMKWQADSKLETTPANSPNG